jgi:hypothetical protein
MARNTLRPVAVSAHAVRAPIERIRAACDEPFALEHVGDARDVAARDHEPSRQLAHLEALWRALELVPAEVETRQCRRDFSAADRARLDRVGRASRRSQSRSDS